MTIDTSIEKPRNKRSKFTAVGLYCGCGGLDLGAKQAGLQLSAAYDSDEIAVETYRRNVSMLVEQFSLGEGLPSSLPDTADVLLGGPPCQGFSSATRFTFMP